jgi:hypothetical protein
MDKRPQPGMVGKGYAYYAARILELRRQQKEAAMRGDFDKVDEIEREIRELENAQTNAQREGAK